MTKSEILSALDASRAALLDVIDGLPPERLLVHVDQRRKPVGAGLGASPDFDSLNARWHAETKDRPLENVLADFHGVRRQTRRWVEEFSEDELTRVRPEPWLQRRPLAVWIAEYSYEHEAEHIQAIRAWRQAAGG